MPIKSKKSLLASFVLWFTIAPAISTNNLQPGKAQ
jgi:hypothetical protein